MKRFVPALVLVLACAAPAAAAGGSPDLLRQVLRQQSAAERSVCAGVRRTLADRNDAALVVRTAVEMGYAPCPVIRCAIEAGAEPAKVVRGASEAGVAREVIARCASDAGVDPAALGAELFEDPFFCYFGPEGGEPGSPLPASPPGGSQRYQPEFSPFVP